MAASLNSGDKRTKKNKLIKKYGPVCQYCKAKKHKSSLTLDHIVPISRGGANGMFNITLACRSCNKKKGSKTRQEFVKQLKEGK